MTVYPGAIMRKIYTFAVVCVLCITVTLPLTARGVVLDRLIRTSPRVRSLDFRFANQSDGCRELNKSAFIRPHPPPARLGDGGPEFDSGSGTRSRELGCQPRLGEIPVPLERRNGDVKDLSRVRFS
jgi:hypothetical protein